MVQSRDVVHEFVVPYHHRRVGVIKHTNRTLEASLKRLQHCEGRTWAHYVPRVIQALNDYPIHRIGKSPLELWNGPHRDRVEARRIWEAERKRVNERRRLQDITFQVGQRVLARDPDHAEGKAQKFAPVWMGPFEIIEHLPHSRFWARKLDGTQASRKEGIVQLFHATQLLAYPEVD